MTKVRSEEFHGPELVRGFRYRDPCSRVLLQRQQPWEKACCTFQKVHIRTMKKRIQVIGVKSKIWISISSNTYQ